MRRKSLLLIAAIAAVGILAVEAGSADADDLARTVLMKKDLEGSPNREITVFVAQYKPGARSGKHYHPGQEFIYVVSGNGRMEEAGKPPVEMTPGTELYFQSDPKNPSYVHEAIDLGTTEGMKLLVVLITEKGQPLAIPAK
jgi:quercetin dioxygenase-like cupin family protein